jgi:hypothetical protein
MALGGVKGGVKIDQAAEQKGATGSGGRGLAAVRYR